MNTAGEEYRICAWANVPWLQFAFGSTKAMVMLMVRLFTQDTEALS